MVASVLGLPVREVKSSAMLGVRLLRRELRRLAAKAAYRRASLAGVPVLFANSFPKSGTHLLTQVLQAFSQVGPAVDAGLPAVVTFDGKDGRRRPVPEILRDIHRFKPGDIGYGHLHALPEVLDVLSGEKFAPYFILRDPRDVVVSHVHYITGMAPGHIHHQYYVQELQTFDERLAASIQGRPDWGDLFPNIRARFQPYLGWLQQSGVLVLRYEDFLANRQEALEKILQHAAGRGFPIHSNADAALLTLEKNMIPAKSPTFRQGKAGGWRKSFSEANKQLFKAAAGDLLVQMGYETGDDW